jgi:flotillin
MIFELVETRVMQKKLEVSDKLSGYSFHSSAEDEVWYSIGFRRITWVLWKLLVYVFAGSVAIALILLLGRRMSNMYHRIPPSQVMVIYGRGKIVVGKEGDLERLGVRFVTGGGAIVWPLVEDFGYLDLTVMTIAKAKDEVYTVDGVPIRLDWVAQVQIDSDE